LIATIPLQNFFRYLNTLQHHGVAIHSYLPTYTLY
jgi:hypothetical protein